MQPPAPSFARNAGTATYYDQRAAEYDEWYLGQGSFAHRNRAGWQREVDQLVSLVGDLPPVRTLDVACGTGFLTRRLRGVVVGLDQSPAMVAVAQSGLPNGVALVGDALDLPFANGVFDRVLTAHFYGHLPTVERAEFMVQARRIAGELIVIDPALRPGVKPAQWQGRVLNDGSRHQVYKRYLSADQLAAEIGGVVLMAGTWFIVAATKFRDRDEARKCGGAGTGPR